MAIAGRNVQGTPPPYALIVLVTLTVILAAGTVWMYLKWSQSNQELAEMRQTQQSLLTSGEAKDQPYKTAEAEALKAEGRPSVVGYLLGQRDELRVAIAGDVALSNADVQKKIDAALRAAQVSLEKAQAASLSGLPLVEVIKTMSEAYDTQSQALSDRGNTLAAAEESAKQAHEQMQAVRTNADQYAAQVRSDMQARQAKVEQYLKEWDANLETVRKDLDELEQTLNTVKGLAQDEVEAMQKTLNQTKRRLQTLIEKVQQWRKEGGIDFTGIVSQADGKIVTMVPGQNLVLIDIGQAEHLPLSLRFEVFSPAERITESTPSKGTIEVVRVGPKLSECQIMRTTPGQSIIAGDLIINTVYDRQNSYVFRVIGEFDLDGSGKPDPNGAKSVELLIERWGGKVVPELEVQTDFLVVGSEPQVPDKPDEFDLAAMSLYEQKLKEHKAYIDAQNRAVALSIPMLNHKRFLYLLGLGNR
ncbi:MAG: hypothetical protein KAT11_05995, partial [Phycisphaerae bacterium]|nr:hypothetical protein [Phycisphaerae bacterium]